ncbi:YceI family protein [Fulvivirga lutimaris]|uniref:YceI family protein n=1 Tax=Fulvivirga lutimaris TaxID=1819566 RepID=UPI0012BB9EA6|nr:YceI family protein [Fulvivirga lutimaris]MTI39069.1 YceI family protein [Fulvivirga lutimaris]
MKRALLIPIITVLAISQSLAQNPKVDREGKASFFSEAPMEDIEAINEKVIGALDMEKGIIAVSMLIKGFHFERSLMEEHFNENYLESDKYPKATFKGVITNFSELDFTKNGSFEAEADGEIEIHGVKKPLKSIVKFDLKNSTLTANTTFEIEVAEFDIEVPKLVIKNIAEVVEVKAAFNFSL